MTRMEKRRPTQMGRSAGDWMARKSLSSLAMRAMRAPPTPRTMQREMTEVKSKRSALWRRIRKRKMIRQAMSRQKDDQ